MTAVSCFVAFDTIINKSYAHRMSFSDAVIQGEALESDNESEIEFDKQTGKRASEFHGTVFHGEAPESDDEILAFSNVNLGTAREITEVYKPSLIRKVSRQPSVEKSILQKFLVGRNQMFWHHLNQHVQHTVVTASSQILAAEELLIQSQLKLQAASRSIKQANEMADQVLEKCQAILTSEFLPDITITT